MDKVYATLFAYPETTRYGVLSFLLFFSGLGVLLVTTADMILFIAGLMVSKHLLDPALTIALCFVLLLAADSIMYEFGARLGPRAFRLPLVRKVFHERRLSSLRSRLKSSEARVARSIRLTPSMRPWVIVVFASLGLGRRPFYSINTAMLVFYVPLFVLSIGWLARVVEPTLGMILGFLAFTWVLNWVLKKRGVEADV